MTNDDEEDFKNSNKSHIRNKEYTKQNNPPTCECGKKCEISRRFIDVVKVLACPSCVVYSSNLREKS